MTTIKPLGKYIFVKLASKVDKTASGIILPNETREQTATVVGIGREVVDVKVGDKIHFQLGDFKPIKHDTLPNDGEYAMIHIDHVVGVYED